MTVQLWEERSWSNVPQVPVPDVKTAERTVQGLGRRLGHTVHHLRIIGWSECQSVDISADTIHQAVASSTGVPEVQQVHLCVHAFAMELGVSPIAPLQDAESVTHCFWLPMATVNEWYNGGRSRTRYVWKLVSASSSSTAPVASPPLASVGFTAMNVPSDEEGPTPDAPPPPAARFISSLPAHIEAPRGWCTTSAQCAMSSCPYLTQLGMSSVLHATQISGFQIDNK